jgi:hypothetical protein
MSASGYRPSANALRHHQTMIQSLPLTIGLANDRWILLDALRKKRNQTDYTGASLADDETRQAIAEAKALLPEVEAFLKHAHPGLLK